MENKKISVTKKEAAERQLNSAIRMFFRSFDPVAVHSVAASGGMIAYDLAEAKTQGKTFERRQAGLTGMEIKSILRALRGASNFFKHARQKGETDTDLRLEFDPSITELVLFYGVCNFTKLLGAEQLLSPEMSVFQAWFIAVNQHMDPKADRASMRPFLELFPDNIVELPKSAQKNEGQKQLEKTLVQQYIDEGLIDQ